MQSASYRCTKCGEPWPSGAAYCPACGGQGLDAKAVTTRTHYRCGTCGEAWPTGAIVCTRCGGGVRKMVPAELTDEQRASFELSKKPGLARRAWDYDGAAPRPPVPPLRQITYDEGRPGAPGLTVTSIRITWGDAFDIFGKFAAVFIFWQLVAAAAVYVLIRVPGCSVSLGEQGGGTDHFEAGDTMRGRRFVPASPGSSA